jgi:hypothetical protein
MQQRLQQQPQNGISQVKVQELTKQVGRPAQHVTDACNRGLLGFDICCCVVSV